MMDKRSEQRGENGRWTTGGMRTKERRVSNEKLCGSENLQIIERTIFPAILLYFPFVPCVKIHIVLRKFNDKSLNSVVENDEN